MADMEGTIEKMMIPKPFKFFDSHAHPGLEKKDIMSRPGCFDMWAGNTVGARSLMGARAALGDPNPTKIITKAEECPELTPETFIQYMDGAGVEAMCLQCIHGITDPFPGNPKGWKRYVPNEYVKKEFIDAFPGRFTAVGGVHARFGKQAAVEMVISSPRPDRCRHSTGHSQCARFPQARHPVQGHHARPGGSEPVCGLH